MGFGSRLPAADFQGMAKALHRLREAPIPSQPLHALPLSAEDLRPLRAVAAARKALEEAAAGIWREDAEERLRAWASLGLVSEVDPARPPVPLAADRREPPAPLG